MYRKKVETGIVKRKRVVCRYQRGLLVENEEDVGDRLGVGPKEEECVGRPWCLAKDENMW